jgi:predicted SPOUT superfamily RNA methylase MTH1
VHQISEAATLHGVQNIIIYNVDYEQVEKFSFKPEPEEKPEAKTTTNASSGAAKDLKPKKLVFGDEPLPKKVVFGDERAKNENESPTVEGKNTNTDRLVDLLNYFVTPPNLRKTLFRDLKPFVAAKKLPKLIDFSSKYTVGLGTSSGKIEKKSSSKKKDSNKTKLVNIGLNEVLELSKDKVQISSRVVIDLVSKKVVTNSDDEEAGRLLGYTVSVVNDLNDILANEKSSKLWVPCTEFLASKSTAEMTDAAFQNIETVVDPANLKTNVFLVFGKWKEIIFSVEEQPENKSVEDLFDGRVRSIKDARVEDAIVIALSKLQAA